MIPTGLVSLKGGATKGGRLVSVIVCAHNEERYVGKCLASLRRALRGLDGEIVFVADRCTDGTVDVARRVGVDKLIEKTWKRWANSYAESLQVGLANSSGEFVSVVDADIVVPRDFFTRMLPLFGRARVASASARVLTYPSTTLNRIISVWEKTHELTPYGREPRGAARVMRREALLNVGGFKDRAAPDTDLDIRLRRMGYEVVYNRDVTVWHMRDITLSKVVRGQIASGIARYELNVSFMRTLAHATFRLRPLVVCGWMMGMLRGGRRAG